MNDSLVGIAQRMQADTEFLGIFSQGVDLRATGDISDWKIDINRRRVVVLGCNREVGATDLASGHTQTIECLRAGHFVNQVQVDVEKIGRTVFTVHYDVISPNLFGQRSAHFPLLHRLLSSHD